MVQCLFEFWGHIGLTDNVHPADTAVFDRLKDGHGFDHSTLPACFMGPLRTSPVVLLYMSPGLSEEADRAFAESEEGQRTYMSWRRGEDDLPEAGQPGHAWWVERTRCFSDDLSLIASKVAVLNIGAYHSKEMRDPELLAALPSSRVCLDWAQNVLFPEALSGKRAVVCLRAAKFWGLRVGKNYDGTLFAPPVTRGGHMLRGEPRSRVIAAVRRALELNLETPRST